MNDTATINKPELSPCAADVDNASNMLECRDLINKIDDLKTILLNLQSSGLDEVSGDIKKLKDSVDIKQLLGIFDSLSFVINSVSDGMVTHTAGMVNNLYGIACESADPSITESIKGLKYLQQSGALKVLIELSDILSFLHSALTDDMVKRVVSAFASIAEELMAPRIVDTLKSMSKCVFSTIDHFGASPPKTGLRSIISVMRDPDIQRGVIFMAHLTKNFQQCLIENH
ncbi:MAG: DUF1641 domain-containing protein [Nitrospirae bacterium]|nr:DUF1641 domain-containing protein [Nitrospirota bacterium]